MSNFGEKNQNLSKIQQQNTNDNKNGKEIQGEIAKRIDEKIKKENLKNQTNKNSLITLKKNYHLENDLLIRNVVPGSFNSPRLVNFSIFLVLYKIEFFFFLQTCKFFKTN